MAAPATVSALSLASADHRSDLTSAPAAILQIYLTAIRLQNTWDDYVKRAEPQSGWIFAKRRSNQWQWHR